MDSVQNTSHIYYRLLHENICNIHLHYPFIYLHMKTDLVISKMFYDQSCLPSLYSLLVQLNITFLINSTKAQIL